MAKQRPTAVGRQGRPSTPAPASPGGSPPASPALSGTPAAEKAKMLKVSPARGFTGGQIVLGRSCFQICWRDAGVPGLLCD